jgi:hypothetical protein
MKSGSFRLWVFASALWIAGCAATLAFRIYAEPACYALFTLSFVNPIPEEDREIVREIQQKLVGKPICGEALPSLLLTLDGLAKKGVATQVAFQWQESGGWSSDTHALIDVLNGKEISIAAIRQEVREAVKTDRLGANIWLAYVVGVPILVFLIGIGLYWVFAGFKSA